jgi:hypothetical protein
MCIVGRAREQRADHSHTRSFHSFPDPSMVRFCSRLTTDAVPPPNSFPRIIGFFSDYGIYEQPNIINVKLQCDIIK